MKDPRLLLFRNKILISKLEPYPKGIPTDSIPKDINRIPIEYQKNINRIEYTYPTETAKPPGGVAVRCETA